MRYRKNLDKLRIDSKSELDIVTEADREVETFIRKAIAKRYPDNTIIGEEWGTEKGNEHTWIIDPIDGTVSFAHGLDHFSISVAYCYRNETIMGAVYAPVLKEFYFAEKGKGAFCNGKPLSVSKRSRLSESVLATGFACLRSRLKRNNLIFFNHIVPRLRCVRRYGSAAYDLALVASGRLEGFWELNLNIYDIAAGILLVAEAGGRITDFKGMGNNLPGEIVATNGLIHDTLLNLLQEAES